MICTFLIFFPQCFFYEPTGKKQNIANADIKFVISKNLLTWIRHKILKVGKTSVRESKVMILMQEKVGIPILKDFFWHYKMKKNITEPG